MNLRLTAYLCIVLLLSACGSKRAAVIVEVPSDVRPVITGDTLVLNVRQDVRQAIVNNALTWLGTPYTYAGEDKNGVDCSGFVMKVFEESAGIKIPRNSAEQQRFAIPQSKAELLSGDLVFFSSKRGGDAVSHVGIFIDGGNFIHASSSRGVIVSSLEEEYYKTHYHSAGRIIQDNIIGKQRENSELQNDSTASERPGDKEARAIRDAVRNAMCK